MTSSTITASARLNDVPVRSLIEMHAETIGLSTLTPEVDPAWEATDAAGHFHAVAAGAGDDRLPTLRWTPRPCPDHYDGDCDSVGDYVCRECAEVLVPATRTPLPTTILGETTWTVFVFDGPKLDLGVAVSFRSDELFGFLIVAGVEQVSNLGEPMNRTVLSGRLHARARR